MNIVDNRTDLSHQRRSQNSNRDKQLPYRRRDFEQKGLEFLR